MYILFPSSYLNRRRVDEAFQKEYDAAIEAGHCPMLFNQQQYDERKYVILNMYPRTKEPIIYRGWMMKPNHYEMFYRQLKESNVELTTSPKEYTTLHCFPFIYPRISKDTPRIQDYSEFYYPALKKEGIALSKINPAFDRFLIKDFAKSAKNTDFPAYFDKNTTQEEFDFWLKRFYEIRGDLFTEGIVIKEYVDLKKYQDKTNEFRVFYANGEPISISRNSLQPTYTPSVPKELVQKYKNLPSLFYTVDYAEKEDGSWIIIETGDGGVSGLSEGQNYDSFYRALDIAFNNEIKMEKE